MNKYFPERYSRVMPNATRELIDARWRGIERLARFIKREDIAPIMVFVRSGKFSSALDEQVRNVFKEEDVNFPMRDRNEELRCLVIETLILAIDQDDANADLLALGQVTSEFMGLAQPDVMLDDLLATAQHRVEKRRTELRTPADLPNSPVLAMKTSLTGYLQTVPANTQLTNSPQFTALLESSNSDVELLQSYMGKTATALGQRQLICEEVNQLALLYVTKYSESFQQPLDELGQERFVAIALELARVTRFHLGFSSAKGYAAQLLRNPASAVESKQIVEIVESLGSNTLFNSLNSNAPDLLVPLSSCIRLHARDGANWRQIAQSTLNAGLEDTRPIVEIIAQLYNETLLSSALAK